MGVVAPITPSAGFIKYQTKAMMQCEIPLGFRAFPQPTRSLAVLRQPKAELTR